MISKPCILFWAGLLFSIVMFQAPRASAASGAPTTKPNVIVILSDDLGRIDEHCYGATDLVTPAFDSLAAHGAFASQKKGETFRPPNALSGYKRSDLRR